MNQEFKNQSTDPITEVYSYRSLVLHPFNKELIKPNSKIRSHIDSEINAINSLNENKTVLALCPILHLLNHTKYEPGIPVGVCHNQSTPYFYFGFKVKNNAFNTFIEKRLGLLNSVFSDSIKFSSKNPRDAANLFWEKMNSLTESDGLPCEFTPILKIKSSLGEHKDLSRFIYKLVFGSKLLKNHDLIESAGLSPSHLDNVVTMELLGEDKALYMRDKYEHIIEIGEIWHRITNLPLVLKIWQKSLIPPSAALKSKMIASAELAQAKMKIDPSVYYNELELENSNFSEKQVSNVWRETSYILGEPEFLSLQILLQLFQNFQQKNNRNFFVKSEKWNFRELHRNPIL